MVRKREYPQLDDPEKANVLREAGFVYHAGLELFASQALRKLAFRDAVESTETGAVRTFVSTMVDEGVDLLARRHAEFSRRQLDHILRAIGWVKGDVEYVKGPKRRLRVQS